MARGNSRTAARIDMTEGSITPKILSFALPIMLGNLFQQLYNVVDSIIVGNFAANGTACLAAVSASFSVMMLFNSLFMGVSMGSNIIVSQFKGAKDDERLQAAMTTTFVLAISIGLVITGLGLCFAHKILGLLGTPEDIMEDASTYLTIILIGTCGNILYNSLNGLIRGLGDSRWPMYALVISAIINIILDTLFVVVFHWDVAGVAWATIIAHVISGLVLLWRVQTGAYGAKIDFKHLKIDKECARLIVKMGLPSAIQNVAMSCGNLVTQRMANRFGTMYLATRAVVTKVDGFLMMPMMGFSTAVTTFVGQNIGAGRIDRTNKGVKNTAIMAECTALLLGTVIYFFGKYVMKLFGVNDTSLAMGDQALKFLAPFYLAMAVNNVLGGCLRGSGAASATATISIINTALRLPMAYFMAIVPLNKACAAAVEAGQFATTALAEAAGIGWENYFGMFRAMGWGMVVGLVMNAAYFFFGDWRSKGVTAKAKAAAAKEKEAEAKA